MNTRQLLLSFGLTLLTTSVVSGEAQCPGNVETLRYHSLEHSQIAVSVTINGTGPYEFLVDTGSQVTILEPSLAAELELKPEGEIDVSAVGNHSQAELAVPGRYRGGPSRGSIRPLVVVESLAQIQTLTRRFVGFWVEASWGISTC